ncbi:MAG: DUF1284 domain-containing protein [Ruminococcus sp.]|nr:DUF1284 domain-containing protein [Ruminococcus sp.]
MSEYKIRPHHILCINFYVGKGYSKEFTENMTRIIENLQKNPLIELTAGHDVICNKCPCTGCAEKADYYDGKVIDICGISGKMHWKDLQKTVREKIINTGRLHEVCGDCQWFYICGKKETC